MKIYVCSNHETICDGYVSDRECYSSEIESAIQSACLAIEAAGHDYATDGLFPHWNGGKFYSAGAIVGGHQYGYRSGHVATLAVDPSEEVKAVIRQADDMLSERLAAVGKLEDADMANVEIDD